MQYPSKLGFSVFASKTPQRYKVAISMAAPVGAYNTEQLKPLKQLKKPFGFGGARLNQETVCNQVPGYFL